MTKQEVFDALVQQLLASGEDQSTVAERAQNMIDGWYYFSSNSVDERGHETCRDWMDPEIVRLLDEAEQHQCFFEQRIKQTDIDDADLAVVTAKLTTGQTKPYETFSMNMSSGYASPIAYFATEAEALAAHDQLVTDVREAHRLRNRSA
jgi:hypothetical protein